jgi:hypothetical protein
VNFAPFIQQIAAVLMLPNATTAPVALPPNAAIGNSIEGSIRATPDNSGMSTTIPPETPAC